MAFDTAAVISNELQLRLGQVQATLDLFAGGATIPFIARYRKEATGNLDEVQIEAIHKRSGYLAELMARKQTVLDSISEQGKLTPELKAAIDATLSKTELEDLYLPYRPKRKTRASVARERGLGPLADRILEGKRGLPPREQLAAPFLDAEKGVPDVEAAFAGARDIVAETIAEMAPVRAALRTMALDGGVVRGRPVKGKEVEGAKFKDYFEFEEPAKALPSHRILALRRGEKEGFLHVTLDVDREAAIGEIRRRVVKDPGASLAADLEVALADAHDRLLQSAIEVDVRLVLKERADAEAIKVFAENLRHLLLAPPLGGKRVMAVDPGYRTGCKVAVLDQTGGLMVHDVVFPSQSEARVAEAETRLAALCQQHRIEAIAVGNGTAGRETEAFLRRLARDGKLGEAQVVVVNESGASVYSASEVAREELPDQDVTVRGAVSIGRRLQDPLAELVKIDPKSIGVGQYQHDVDQPTLERALDGVVESCVNAVGVDVNTASARLLRYVAGIGESLARNIVAHRSATGPFRSRADLRKVSRLGPKAFEQAAGFLRVRGGHPLDNSAVHPESYDIVERMAKDLSVDARELVGRDPLIGRIDPARYVDSPSGGDAGEGRRPHRGEFTVRDILDELRKAGRYSRAAFEAVNFREDVTSFEHLVEGMALEGVVTNVTRFGAFVDVGVHHDGLLHISEMSDRFVKDPAEVVKVGDRVKVRVIKLDVERRRFSLSMKAPAGTARDRSTPTTAPARDRSTPPTAPARGRSTPPAAPARSTPPAVPSRDRVAPARTHGSPAPSGEARRSPGPTDGPDRPGGRPGGGGAPFNGIRIRSR